MVKNYLGIEIDYSRDSIIPEQGYAMLTKKGFYKKDNEKSPQESFARAATCFSYGDLNLAQRLYDAVSKQWFTFASPVLSNAVEHIYPENLEFDKVPEYLKNNVKAEGLPISCFLSYIPDTREGLVSTRAETSWLSMMGGGVGLYAGMRSVDEKSTGVMAHMRGYDSDAKAYKQGETRRGSYAAYLPIDHPEILNFIDMRNPVGGDPNLKCFNLNNGVNVTDEFMEAMVSGEDYELIDPKHGATGRFLSARDVWHKLLEVRKDTGEPYLEFIDTVNRNLPTWITNKGYHVSQSNLCVAPETQVLTSKGHIPIAELENETVEVWNGEEFSETVIKKTGEDQKLLKVITSSGQSLQCTPYHKWYVFDGYGKPYVEKRTYELVEGDKLAKFDLPVISGEDTLDKAYQNGFYSADGCCVNGKSIIYLYHEKRKLRHLFDFETHTTSEKENRELGRVSGLKDKYFVPSHGYSVESRLAWLAGWLDGDGCVYRNGSNQQLVGCSVEKEFILDIQRMLQTLGVSAKLNHAADAGYKSLPKNNGTGEMGQYWCREAWRLLITSCDVHKLMELGIGEYLHRLDVVKHLPQRDAKQFNKVVSVLDEGRIDDTYCFNEPKRHMGMFNGILTGQCNEIQLMTDEDRTAVCCLSSLNLDKFDEWKDTTLVADLVTMLDNVLEYFIALAPDVLKRAIYSAEQERAIGLGTLGFASYLQSKGIPFESGGFNSAVQENYKIYKKIKDDAVRASLSLGSLRGEAPDCEGSGMRNSHLMAIAPNASSSSLINVSPSIEPLAGIAFTAQGRSGSFLIKNSHFDKLMSQYATNNGLNDVWINQQWKLIINDNGSVQSLNWLSDHDKKVYKTSPEIDQRWVIEHASIRQPLICQGQSVNLAIRPEATAQQVSDLHFTAWKKGLKGLYYYRTTSKVKATVGDGTENPLNAVSVKPSFDNSDDNECLACEG